MDRFKRLSKREQLDANQRALDQLAILSGKPRVVLHTPKAPRQSRPRDTTSKPPLEHAEQVRVIQFWSWYSKTIGADWRQLVAVPNGQMLLWTAKNPNAMLNYLKAEGMRKGMLDLVLFLPRRASHGLVLELKRSTGGVISDDQHKMANVFTLAGYVAAFANGADAAIKIIQEYCEG